MSGGSSAYLGVAALEELPPSKLDRAKPIGRSQGRPDMSNPLQDNFLWRMERVGKVTGSRVADIVAQNQDRLQRIPRDVSRPARRRAADRGLR